MTTDDKYKILKEFYSNGEEDKRLYADKAHHVEFLTTTRYIDKFLKPNAKILEVGAEPVYILFIMLKKVIK